MKNYFLCRGKTVNEDKWVIGFYEENNEKSFINYEETIEKYGKSLKVMRSAEIIPETIGRYVGLKDKNKKLIFEGDICKTDKCIYVIVWNKEKYGWFAQVIKSKYALVEKGLQFPLWHYDNCKENEYQQFTVIGNIIDNKESLKKNEKISPDHEFRGFHPTVNGEEIICLDDRKIKGTWYYGYYVKNNNVSYIYFETPDDFTHGSNYLNQVEVLEDTVDEFTGRLDENGKKIYKNDIVVNVSENRLTDRKHIVKKNTPYSGYLYIEENRKPVIVGNIYKC